MFSRRIWVIFSFSMFKSMLGGKGGEVIRRILYFMFQFQISPPTIFTFHFVFPPFSILIVRNQTTIKNNSILDFDSLIFICLLAANIREILMFSLEFNINFQRLRNEKQHKKGFHLHIHWTEISCLFNK